MCQTSPGYRARLEQRREDKVLKAQGKEPEAAKEYDIYQFFYQSIEDGCSQSTNNDQNIAEELEVKLKGTRDDEN